LTKNFETDGTMKSIRVFTGIALLLSLGVASAQTFSSSDGPISIGPLSTNGVYTPASRYPSQIVVPGSVAGTVTSVSVRIKGLNADGNSGSTTLGLGILLVSPDGRQFELHRDTSDASETLTNLTLNIADANSIFLPDQNTAWPLLTGTGSFKPAAYPDTTSPTNYPAPGPGTPAHSAAPAGTDTFSSVFTGAIAAGTWNLYVVDHFLNDAVSFTGWDLILTVAATTSSTSTTLSSATNPSFTSGANSSVTLSAIVSSASAAPTGTVLFRDGVNTIPGCSASPLTPGTLSSTATCVTVFGTEGNHSLTAVYGGAGSFAASTSAALNQFVKNHSTSPATNQFCNVGPISAPGTSNTVPYPSVINIGTDTPSLANAVATLTLTLSGVSAPTGLGAVKAVLVGPGGSKSLVFLSNAGFSGGQPSVNLTFADTAAGQVAQNGVLSSTGYQPTSYDSPTISSPPAPAPQPPASLSVASPGGGVGAKTLTTAFNGQMPNGDWSLFLFDAGGTSSNASISGGWCINVTPAAGTATATTVGSSLNPAINGNPVAITATVTEAISHLPVTLGAVTFTENGLPVAGALPAGPVNLDLTGHASFTTTALSEGDHIIQATYNDSTSFSLSFATIIQRIDRGTTGPTVQGSTLIFCNPNNITIPANSTSPLDIGAANPNPSNIFVSGLAGAISSVSVTLNGFQHPFPQQLSTLLVGPQDTNAASFDFFSGGGGTAPFGPATLQLVDTALNLVPFSAPPAPSNKPTSYTGNDSFTASPSGFYTLPGGPYVYAAPAGGATFGSVFNNTNPNGTWSLYFNQTTHAVGGGLTGGWCLNVDLIRPVLSITKTHVGNFSQGQTGATYTITATNNGPGPTGGTVTVSDALPSGLTATAISGTGWSCTQPSGPCNRSDALPMGSSYPALTLTVNVAANASTPLVNQATVSGGGDPGNHTANDSTIISPASDLTISKSHAGNFKQGDTGDTYGVIVTNSGAGPTTGTVTVVDTLPAGLTATAISGTGWTCVLGTLTCTRGDALAAAASYPAITVTVNVANNAPASVTNTATVSGGGETNTGNDTASDPTTITQVADLLITKSHSGNFRQGDVGDTYSIVVNNAGPGPSVGTVTVVDTLPAGLTATAISGTGWTCVLGTLTCTRTDSLGISLSYPAITVTVNVANNAPTTVTNNATVSGGGELNTANDSASDPTAITAVADLTITKSHSGNFRQGDTGDTYSITVSNAGPGATVGTVTVTDTLPSGLTATAISGTGWTCVLGTLSCTRTDVLAAAASYPAITVTVNVASNAPATVTNTATVSGGGELNTANDSASDPTTIAQAADLTITKSHSVSFQQGDSGDTYSVVVSNAGPGATVGTVTVTDTLPSGLTATAISGTGWTCVLGTLSCTRTDALAAAASYPTITVTVNVASNAPPSVTNTATVSGGGELNTANDSASDPTTIVQLVSVTVTTAPTGLSFSVDSVTYTSAQTFQFVQGSTHTIATTTPQTPSAGTQDLFLNWSDGGALSHNITAPATATTYTANFQQQFLLTTAVVPAGGGTVTGAGFYNAGTTANVAATANAGFSFVSFTGTTSPATQNPGTVLMDAPKTVTANFLIPTATVVSAATGVYSDPTTLTATVSPVSVGSQVLTGTVAFTVNGGNAGVAAINASGVATVSYSVQLGAGPYTIGAQFVSGNPAFANSAGSNTLTVSRENATVTPSSSNPFSVPVTGNTGTAASITVGAAIHEVTDATLGNISNAVPVTCTLNPVAPAPVLTQTATVSGGGIGGTLNASCTFTNVPVDVYELVISVGGTFYTGSSSSTLAVFDPNGGFTTGGGTITHNGVNANFSFNAKYKNNGSLDGTLLYIEHRSTGDVKVQGSVAHTLAVSGNGAVFVMDVTLNGVSGYSAIVAVVDNGEPGSNDTFALALTGPGNTPVTDLTFTPITISGGNIQIHN
jgi:uncharacterized repeat protein (TIGR01451 family)